MENILNENRIEARRHRASVEESGLQLFDKERGEARDLAGQEEREVNIVEEKAERRRNSEFNKFN